MSHFPEDAHSQSDAPKPSSLSSGESSLPVPQLPSATVSSSDEASPQIETSGQQDSPPLLFQHWEQRQPPAARIPHLGHCAILASIAIVALLITSLAVLYALHIHLFGITTRSQATLDIRYNLGSEAILYTLLLAGSLTLFPLLWQKSFFAGLQWNGATAFRLRTQLFMTAILCFLLAMLSGMLLPGPKDAPIDKIFRSPGAPWLLFAFGTTFAPFFEELIFRGFLLPALCTAWDWTVERMAHTDAPPLGDQGHPQWSYPAMLAGALFTSVPFAAIHAAQTGYAWGPFLLLICVSLILCMARLKTRSLAASVLVHATYNFLLFSLMLLGSAGFKHLENL